MVAVAVVGATRSVAEGVVVAKADTVAAGAQGGTGGAQTTAAVVDGADTVATGVRAAALELLSRMGVGGVVAVGAGAEGGEVAA